MISKSRIIYFRILLTLIFLGEHNVMSKNKFKEEEIEFHEIADKYFLVQKINTGYRKEVPKELEEIYSLPKKDDWKLHSNNLMEKMKSQGDRLKCCYMYSALFYFHLVRYLLEDTHELRLIEEDDLIKCFFVEETTNMLASMWSSGMQTSMRGIWYIHVYTKSLQDFLKESYTKNLSYDDKNVCIDEIDAVLRVLQKRTDDRCNNANVFNYKLDGLNHQSDIKSLELNPKQIVKRLKIMKCNKDMIEALILANIRFGFKINDRFLFFHERLMLNNVFNNKDKITDLINYLDIQIEDMEIPDRMINNFTQLRYNKLNISEKIKHINLYIQDSIDLMKILFLRLLWKFLLYVNDQLTEYKSSIVINKNLVRWTIILNKSLKTMVENAIEFVRYFDLGDDAYFTRLINYLKFAIQLTLEKKSARNHLAIEEIKFILRKICNKLTDVNFNIKERITELTTNLEIFQTNNELKIEMESSDHLINYYVNSTNLYLEYIKKNMKGINFSVIKLFLKHSF
ncbi:uncharacterized protein LOC126907835 [Daktulosphaira vitifoliae]|uniref:uncharacterized protein LOC126907835 n=1 Tax=Daktulosphaira vitifoliae TaxID=58002 RepID=UPI0021AAB218|nr:uncharacterized protein LOC126907835 [Daktulosphaira vitifoliae]